MAAVPPSSSLGRRRSPSCRRLRHQSCVRSALAGGSRSLGEGSGKDVEAGVRVLASLRLEEDRVIYGKEDFVSIVGPQVGDAALEKAADQKLLPLPIARYISAQNLPFRGLDRPLQVLAENTILAWEELLPDLGEYLPERLSSLSSLTLLDSTDPEGRRRKQNLPPDIMELVQVVDNGEKEEEEEEMVVKEGGNGGPAMVIQNFIRSSGSFRKLHVEIANASDGLQVYHCVFYPWEEVDFPLLSIDMVSRGGKVTFAIADPCPVTADLSLPPLYQTQLDKVLRGHDRMHKWLGRSTKGVPEWGKQIFSERCVLMRPGGAEDEEAFVRYAVSLIRLHLKMSMIIRVKKEPIAKVGRERMLAIREAQHRYCKFQLENDKTAKVLERAFGKKKTDAYMKRILFDVPSPSEVAEAEAAYEAWEKEQGGDVVGVGRVEPWSRIEVEETAKVFKKMITEKIERDKDAGTTPEWALRAMEEMKKEGEAEEDGRDAQDGA